MKNVDVLVIGAGAAGMAAALAAAEQGAKVLLVEREDRTGGILNQCIHNGFGLHYFKRELTGPEYAEIFREKLERSGIDTCVEKFVLEVDVEKREVIVVSKKGIEKIHPKSLILATGARERPFGSLLIPGDRPSGIYTAGVVQRLINIENRLPGKRALILGSGDIGLIMARRLTLEGMEVVGVVERLPYPGGLLRNVVQCLEDFDIPLFLSSTVVEVRGKERLEEVVVASVDEKYNPIPGTERTFKVDTLVLSVGLIPQVELVSDFVEIDRSSKGFAVSNTGQTSVSWIFAAGNSTVIYDLVDYVTYEGEIAGRSAVRYIDGKGVGRARVNVEAGENIGILFPKWFDPLEDLTMYIRVRKPIEKGILIVEGVLERKIENLVPSEMIRIKIPKSRINASEKLKVFIKEE